MRIAHISPLTESVPPRGYGGIERVVAYLVEELIHQGQQVTLFASGDSATSAELVPCSPRALGYDPAVKKPIPYYAAMIEAVGRRAREFDILHFHFDFLHFLMLQDCPVPMLTTIHGWPYLLDLLPFYSCCFERPLISISHQQRQLLPHLSWIANIYHGLPLDLYPFTASPREDYLAFIGRICPEKGPEHAIAIARLAGMKLRLAGNVKQEDKHFFDRSIAPLLGDPLIEYIGEIGDHDKAGFLGGARALLFPIQWPEPFGLVMIEAMACGTPVIAYRSGSVAEIVEPGLTGFVVETVKQAAEAVQRLDTLDRSRIRERFEERFSVRRMAHDHLSIYSAQLEKSSTRVGRSHVHDMDCSEPEFLPAQRALESRNHTLLPPAAVDSRSNIRKGSRKSWIWMEFRSGLSYSRDRARNWSAARRLLYAGGAPLIPVVRSARILKQLCSGRVLRNLRWNDIQQAPFGLIVSALGEMAGYVLSADSKFDPVPTAVAPQSEDDHNPRKT